MSKTAHVFSTLSNDQLYTNYKLGDNGRNIVDVEIHIKGGANVAEQKRVTTPYGVATEVTEEALVELEKNPVFRMHKDKGFITIRQRHADPDKVATDMARKDLSAPLTMADSTEVTKMSYGKLAA